VKIAVCIKQVPDTEAEVKWDTPKGTLKRDGMSPITNPFDEFALEEALLTREKYDGDIVVITMGPEKANDVLRNAWHSRQTRCIAAPMTPSQVPTPMPPHRPCRCP